MIVGCPATHTTQLCVMHMLHDGGWPSNIEKWCGVHGLHDGGLPSNIEKKWCVQDGPKITRKEREKLPSNRGIT